MEERGKTGWGKSSGMGEGRFRVGKGGTGGRGGREEQRGQRGGFGVGEESTGNRERGEAG